MPAKTTQQSEDLNNPYGYSDMDWAAQLDPAYAAARAEVRRLSVGEDGTLSVKVKELIVLGVFASRGLQYGVAAHMRRAIDYGATKEELFEAIKAAAVPGGGVAYSVGVRALQALEQDGAFPPAHPAFSLAEPAGQSQPTSGPPAGQSGHAMSGEVFPLLREHRLRGKSRMSLPGKGRLIPGRRMLAVWSSVGCSAMAVWY